jgi:hypothetical protein
MERATGVESAPPAWKHVPADLSTSQELMKLQVIASVPSSSAGQCNPVPATAVARTWHAVDASDEASQLVTVLVTRASRAERFHAGINRGIIDPWR